MVSDMHGLITGASRGIGFELAVMLLRQNALVSAVSRSGDVAERLLEEVPDASDRVNSLQADLSRVETISQLVEQAVNRFGRIDFLVNNAGVAESKPIGDVRTDDLARHMSLNVYAPFELSRLVSSYLQASPVGVIINVCSASAHEGYEHQAAYVASKHALLGLTKVTAREFAQQGIRVHAVSPSATDTSLLSGVRPDLEQSNGLLSAKTVAEAICLLLERGGEFGVDELSMRRPGKLPWS